MSRRGRCRCGAILEFQKTSQGYKTRCGQCQAVVRLRGDAPPPVPTYSRKKTPVPAEGLFLAEEHSGFAGTATKERTGPVADPEIPAYQDPQKSTMTFWLLGGLAVLVVVGIGLAVAVFGG